MHPYIEKKKIEAMDMPFLGSTEGKKSYPMGKEARS
jgi:hypothetical protein